MCTAHLHVFKFKATAPVRLTVMARLYERRTDGYNKAVNLRDVLRPAYSFRDSCGLPWSYSNCRAGAEIPGFPARLSRSRVSIKFKTVLRSSVMKLLP